MDKNILASLSGIRNLLFDFGGVIIDIDYHAVRNAFQKLGMKDVMAFYKHDAHSKYVEDYEQGLISEERFKSHIDKEIGRILSKTEFETAWNAIIKEIPEPRVRLLESLASQYNLYLLSNTNSIHYRYYTSQFRQTFGRELQSLFTKTYFSYQIKMRKPNEDIFEFVAKDAAIQKPETLFIDDSPLNIDTAQKLGFKTFHKPQQEEITQFF